MSSLNDMIALDSDDRRSPFKWSTNFEDSHLNENQIYHMSIHPFDPEDNLLESFHELCENIEMKRRGK